MWFFKKRKKEKKKKKSIHEKSSCKDNIFFVLLFSLSHQDNYNSRKHVAPVCKDGITCNINGKIIICTPTTMDP